MKHLITLILLSGLALPALSEQPASLFVSHTTADVCALLRGLLMEIPFTPVRQNDD